jgi:hypothetical protein
MCIMDGFYCIKVSTIIYENTRLVEQNFPQVIV